MTYWKCRMCGYVYNPETGDEKNGIKPGTEFKDLPEEWICPKCGASKSKFIKVE